MSYFPPPPTRFLLIYRIWIKKNKKKTYTYDLNIATNQVKSVPATEEALDVMAY